MKLRKFSLPKSLEGSPPSHADMEAFIRYEWADDQTMYQALKHGIDVVSLNRVGATIEVSVVFFSNPSDLGEDNYKLFGYEDSGFFPTCIQRMTMKERYIWQDSLSCDRLDNQAYYWDHLDLDVENFEWDDPTFPEDLFVECLQRFDETEIGASLVTLYDAGKSMPAFVPTRLKPYFQQFIADYLTSVLTPALN